MILLQAVVKNSEALNSTVNQLTESSIKLAEAAANFGALKVIFGVFLVFMLIMMIAFFWQLFSTQKKVNDIHISSTKVEKFLEDTDSRTVGKEQASIVIRRSFNSLAQSIKYAILRTRLENHLGQKEYVTNKVTRLIKYEYAELSSFLANFECEGEELSGSLKVDDSQLIVDFMLEQIYTPKDIFAISTMDQATDILLNGLKIEALRKVS